MCLIPVGCLDPYPPIYHSAPGTLLNSRSDMVTCTKKRTVDKESADLHSVHGRCGECSLDASSGHDTKTCGMGYLADRHLCKRSNRPATSARTASGRRSARLRPGPRLSATQVRRRARQLAPCALVLFHNRTSVVYSPQTRGSGQVKSASLSDALSFNRWNIF